MSAAKLGLGRALAALAVVLGASLVAEDAGAVVGRPLTPMSYAGVARRSSRRVARRTASRYSAAAATTYTALPAGCGPITPDGYYVCGGSYYRPYYQGTQVVYVIESPDEE